MNRTLLVALIALLALTMFILMGGRSALQTTSIDASPAAGSSPSGSPAEFLPMLKRASAQAELLVTLGESRERNLLRIRAEQNAMLAALTEADAWVGANPASQSHQAIAAYREGAAKIRAAMDEAQAGFLRFDFDRVARAHTELQRGTRLLHEALDLLAPP